MTIEVQDQSKNCFPYACWGLYQVGACVSGYVIGIENRELWIEENCELEIEKLKMRVSCGAAGTSTLCKSITDTKVFEVGDKRVGWEGGWKLNCGKGEFGISDFWLLMPSHLHYFGIYWENVYTHSYVLILFQYTRLYMKYLWDTRNVKFNEKVTGFLGLSHALIMHNDPKIDDP